MVIVHYFSKSKELAHLLRKLIDDITNREQEIKQGVQQQQFPIGDCIGRFDCVYKQTNNINSVKAKIQYADLRDVDGVQVLERCHAHLASKTANWHYLKTF